MDAGTGYGGLQQPSSGGYTDAGIGPASPNYSGSQNPPSTYSSSGAGPTSSPLTLANGVNLQPSYYFGGNVDLGWDEMKKYPNIKSVRIEIEAGQEANAQRWIKEALAYQHSVIATFHKGSILTEDQTQMDNPDQLLTSAAWWAAYYPQLSESGEFVINLMNEWGSNGITPHDFAATYNQAISTVRQVYSGPIVVDVPGFAHECHTAALAVQEFADRNIILSTHIYPDAWSYISKSGMTTADLDELASTGLQCIVGEFGDNGKKPTTPWSDLVKYATSTKGWKVFGWAWAGDGGIMNMIDPKTFLPFTAPPAKPPVYKPTAYLSKIYPLL